MKKIYCILLVSVLLHSKIFGQTIDWGFSAGITVAYIQTNAFALTTSNSMTGVKTGFTAGAFACIPITRRFIFQPGLNFVQKGGSPFDGSAGNQRGAILLNYIELPLNLVYKSAGKRGHFIAGGGPCVAFGISGTAKLNQQETDIKFGGNGEFDLKHFDAGANMLIGYELNNGISLLLNINAGLLNVSVIQSEWQNNYFGLRLGYLFSHNSNSINK